MNGQAINALGYLMHQIRPEWDPPGCVAALRKMPDLTLTELALGAIRYAADETNLTPANLPNFTNRAWDVDWYLPCKVHPLTRARRTNGECAACHADRLAATGSLPLRRHGVPPTLDQRAAMRAALHAPGRERSAEALTTSAPEATTQQNPGPDTIEETA